MGKAFTYPISTPKFRALYRHVRRKISQNHLNVYKCFYYFIELLYNLDVILLHVCKNVVSAEIVPYNTQSNRNLHNLLFWTDIKMTFQFVAPVLGVNTWLLKFVIPHLSPKRLCPICTCRWAVNDMTTCRTQTLRLFKPFKICQAMFLCGGFRGCWG